MNTDMNTNTDDSIKCDPDLDPFFSDPAMDIDTDSPTETAAVTSIKERAQDWQKKTDEVVEEALLGVPKRIHNFDLVPFSTARASLLRRINNEFVKGVRLDAIEDPFIAVGKFLVMMTGTLDKARSLVNNPDKLEEEAYAILENIHMSDMADVVVMVNDYVKREMHNQVHGEVAESNDPNAPKPPKN